MTNPCGESEVAMFLIFFYKINQMKMLFFYFYLGAMVSWPI